MRPQLITVSDVASPFTRPRLLAPMIAMMLVALFAVGGFLGFLVSQADPTVTHTSPH